MLGYAPHVEVAYVPPLLLVLLVFTLAVTLLVSSLLVYLRDLRHALPMVLQAMLFITPVAYKIEPKSHGLRLLYSALNPVAPVINGLRAGVLFGRAPDWAGPPRPSGDPRGTAPSPRASRRRAPRGAGRD